MLRQTAQAQLHHVMSPACHQLGSIKQYRSMNPTCRDTIFFSFSASSSVTTCARCASAAASMAASCARYASICRARNGAETGQKQAGTGQKRWLVEKHAGSGPIQVMLLHRHLCSAAGKQAPLVQAAGRPVILQQQRKRCKDAACKVHACTDQATAVARISEDSELKCTTSE